MTDLFTESVIADMKKSLMAAADKGARCPCCNQMFKIYKIPMNGTQVSLLKNAYLQHGLGWFHISSLRNHDSGSGAFAKLRYYGFLVEQVHDGRWSQVSQRRAKGQKKSRHPDWELPWPRRRTRVRVRRYGGDIQLSEANGGLN